MRLDKITDDATTQMLDLQMKNNPAFLKKRPTVLAFFRKYMAWEALKEDYIQIISRFI